MNNKLQEKGFNCYFKCNYNWFKQQTNFANSGLIDWNGLYNCIEPNCSSFIKPKIYCQPIENIVIQVSYCISNQHNRIKKNIRISGNERKALAQTLKSEGVLNFACRNNFENYLGEKS